MFLINRVIRMAVMAVFLLVLMGAAHNVLGTVEAQAAFDFNVVLNPYSISMPPNHAGYVQVTVSLISGTPRNVTLSSSVYPQDGQVSISFAQVTGSPPFLTTLIVNASLIPSGKTYTITITGVASSSGLTHQAPPLTLTISCSSQGPCPHLDSTDKTSYAQGDVIQFRGSGFSPGDQTASCLTTGNSGTSVCQNQGVADGQGNVSGSMQVSLSVPIGAQQFYLKDLATSQQSNKISLTITPQASLLTTSYVGEGSVTPSCPSGCAEPIGQTVNVTATPAVGWTFSGWNVTGAACSAGAASNPCLLTMTSAPVAVTANFTHSQTLVTSYTGQGSLSPSCPSGCQIVVGFPVSIFANPAPGWVIEGYHLSNGVQCNPQMGYTCSFVMPDFPVYFQVTFSEATVIAKVTTTVTSSTQAIFTSTSVIGNTVTSTITSNVQSIIQVSGSATIVTYSTSTVTNAQTQNSVMTFSTTIITTSPSIDMKLEDPGLELTLAVIIVLSSTVLGFNMIRKFARRTEMTCANCGSKNLSSMKYCVSCGETLKEP